MTPAAPAPKPRAFSYVRFSTPEQMAGKSFERQTEAPLAWCKQHGVELDTEVTYHDLGVSAFKGKNADVHALGAFLKAVHTGTVPTGSYLLVESFDRISREAAFDAQMVVQNLLHAGITIVTLMDGKEYNVQIMRTDPVALILMILTFTRGHEESVTKSKRISDAWRRKRADTRKTGKVITAMAPSWLTLDKSREWKVVPQHADTVRLMFKLLLAGTGKTGIVAELNAKKVPTLRNAPYWGVATVQKCLTNKAVMGEFQPHREDTHSRTRKRIPDGEPIPNYYPMIVDKRTFERAQKLIEQHPGRQYSHFLRGKTIRNMLAGLAKCPSCGDSLVRAVKSSKQSAYYVCSRARVGAGCKYRCVSVNIVERALLANAEHLTVSTAEAGDTLAEQIATAEAELKASQTKLDEWSLLLDDTPSKTLATRISTEEDNLEQLKNVLDLLKSRAQRSNSRLLKENARKMRDALLWHKQDPSDLIGVNASLRECFEKIIVDYDARQLVMHWRHGATSTIRYSA